MTPDEIRETYLRYFEERGHTRVPSASLVPENDPTLLFTGAGMNQFKDEFLGKGRRGLSRATTSQKCLRTGDLDNVGRTPGHHSFFEMLGNFSFGDYFKAEATQWAWDFLTRVMAIDPSRLHATVYEGDDEAYALWRERVGIPAGRLHRLGAKSNFWPANAPEAGPNGVCGPCSEIFFDYGPQQGSQNDCPDPAKCDPSCDCGRFIEVWNLVFTQFDRREGGELVPLPQRNIDTGMGFERLVAVHEGVHATMDSSLFRPLLAAVAAAARRPAYEREGENGVRARRIADHVRAGCFLVADGVRPGNEGRDYVLRRLLRRAIRDGAGLSIEGPFLAGLVPAVLETMGGAYPELREGVATLEAVLAAEEAQFGRTFENGMRRLEAAVERLREQGGTALPAEMAFQLHDTYGFPVDMTAEILAEQGLGFDRARFDDLMEEQRVRARSAQKMSENIFDRGPVGELAERGVAPTLFEGYGDAAAATREERHGSRAQGRVAGVIVDERLRDELRPAETGSLVLDRTPFYAESGGQVGDVGRISLPAGVFHVEDTQARGGFHLHVGRYEGSAPVRLGDVAEATVDEERRDATRRNHTATHVLHRALKKVLGESVQQQGSLVAPDRLRFDFRFERPLTSDERRAVEDEVNREIVRNDPLVTALLPVEEAKRTGAVALFGEKYPDPVRVVAVGEYSRELCGGTHCAASGDIGSFRIVSEGSIAAGIRRIEAVTGLEALRRMQEDRDLLAQLSQQLGGLPPKDLPARIGKMQASVKAAGRAGAVVTAGGAAPDQLRAGDPVEQDGLAAWARLVDWPRDQLVAAAEAFAKQTGSPQAVLSVTTDGGKTTAVVAANAAAVAAGFDASAFLKASGARGGGKRHFAQGTFPGTVTSESLTAGLRMALQGWRGRASV